MKKKTDVLWGIILVVLGFLLALSKLDIIEFDLFFAGWWTLFIIIPSIRGIIVEDDKVFSFVGLIIGVLLLFACRGDINFDIIWKLLVPIILVSIGLSLIFKNLFTKKISEKVDELTSSLENSDKCVAVFSSQVLDVPDNYKGTKFISVFGSSKIDLRNVKLATEVVIDAKCVFGGVEVILPEGVNVKIVSNSVFGGVENKYKKMDKNSDTVVYINTICVFGSVDVK